MSKDDRLYLYYILDCIERIESYTEEGEATFLREALIQDATLRNLHTLAESTQRLSDELKTKYPIVDWRSIAGFRNVVVHNYLGISLVNIWKIVAQDLPLLKQNIQRIIDELH